MNHVKLVLIDIAVALRGRYDVNCKLYWHKQKKKFLMLKEIMLPVWLVSLCESEIGCTYEDVQWFFLFREPSFQMPPLGPFAGPYGSCAPFGEDVEAYSQPYHRGHFSG